MPTGRYAPSPTGSLHVGNLRTALLAWLFARSSGSRFLMRVEDLDPATSSDERAKEQLADLVELGLDWDGEVVYQSERRQGHEAALAQLENAGLLYPCYCSRREIREAASAPNGEGPVWVAGANVPAGAYPGTCRDLSPQERSEREATGRRPALRVRAGGEVVRIDDRVVGISSGSVDDFVVRRADGGAAYQLAVVVDDAAQGVEEVVRGDDLLSSTPRQIWLARVLGLEATTYAHVPLVLGPDGRRLAKRHGAVSLGDLREVGVAAGELLATMAASLGLTEPGEAVASPRHLVDRFDPADLHLDPWIFDPARSVRRR